MKDQEKAKEQLVTELGQLRRQIVSLRATEIERKEAEEALQKERQLLRRSLNFHERERKLVAYEIHDGLAQQLAGALLQFQIVSQHRDENPDEAQQAFDAATQLVSDSLDEARRLIAGLRPLILNESGIVPTVDYLVCEANARGGPEIEFVHSFQFDRLAPPLEMTVFRIIQEALTNACRHSQSEKVRVKLVGENDQVCIEVRDWGIGFDPDQVDKTRLGLEGIRERARLFGGHATIDTAPGKGTQIVVELELPKDT